MSSVMMTTTASIYPTHWYHVGDQVWISAPYTPLIPPAPTFIPDPDAVIPLITAPDQRIEELERRIKELERRLAKVLPEEIELAEPVEDQGKRIVEP